MTGFMGTLQSCILFNQELTAGEQYMQNVPLDNKMVMSPVFDVVNLLNLLPRLTFLLTIIKYFLIQKLLL